MVDLPPIMQMGPKCGVCLSGEELETVTLAVLLVVRLEVDVPVQDGV